MAKKTFENIISNLLGEPTSNLCHAFYDQYVEANVRIRSKLGMKELIIRRQLGKCCKWCADLAGIYSPENAPADIYRRHDNCKCMVTYKDENGYTDAWSKKEFSNQKEARKNKVKELWDNKYKNKLNYSDFTDIMYRKKKGNDYIEPMPRGQLMKIVKAFKKQGGVIQMNAETDYYLKHIRHVEGITLNANTVCLMRKPGRASVFEELIHTTQYRKGRMDGTRIQNVRCEIEAKKKLLKYQKAYKLTPNEIKATEKSLEDYIKELADLEKEVQR